ncbi:hypothetical protein [Streptomyces sp. NPDC058872]|uniref:hypothetical protein n=1 Tax=Streptomyces sp. NPDC058872 TaxID=3346661 RepID=UPI00369AF2B6
MSYESQSRTLTSPRFTQLLAPWGLGILTIVVLLVATALFSWEVVEGGEPDLRQTLGGVVLLVHLPAVLSYAVGTWVAGAVHRAPSKDHGRRHLAALLVPAAAVQLFAFLSALPGPSLIGVLIALVDLFVGCALGYGLDRLRRR